MNINLFESQCEKEDLEEFERQDPKSIVKFKDVEASIGDAQLFNESMLHNQSMTKLEIEPEDISPSPQLMNPQGPKE